MDKMDKISKEKIAIWNTELQSKSLKESIKFVLVTIEGKKVFSTSFGIEDQVLSHVLYPYSDQFSIFTLDTGRQFEETYEVFQKTTQKYSNYKIETFFQNEKDVQEYVFTKGINVFYDSIENRKDCCFIRKVKTLKRAIKDVNLWITGLRAEQFMNPQTMQFLEWDEDNQLIKFNPLLHFTLSDVEKMINDYVIPNNSLFKKGYVSIGYRLAYERLKKVKIFVPVVGGGKTEKKNADYT
jgi:phosphoadenosine phosphosulfate reductase